MLCQLIMLFKKNIIELYKADPDHVEIKINIAINRRKDTVWKKLKKMY